MATLDLSKFHMHELFYNVLEPKYGNKIKLAYTDTDRFVIHIERQDVLKDVREICEHLRFLFILSGRPSKS